MARIIYGSAPASDTSTVVQLTASTGKAMAVAVKARATNTSAVYFGTDSGVSATTGFTLEGGDREDWDFHGAIDASEFHVLGASSGDRLDWVMEVEN